MQDQLLERVRSAGGKASNPRLMRELNWPEDDYWPVRDRLVDLGFLRRYRAWGGAVAIVEPAAPVAAVAKPVEMIESADAAFRLQARERDLYKPVAEVLRGAWAKESRFRHHLVEITALQGRRSTGGVWTRPDIVVAALRVFPYLPGKYFDLVSFEVKPDWALSVTGVYEALAHRRAATQAYLWVHCPDANAQSEVLGRISEEAERHGIGFIVAGDPADFETWEERCEPLRIEPDPASLNEFVALQVSDGAKDELAAWVR